MGQSSRISISFWPLAFKAQANSTKNHYTHHATSKSTEVVSNGSLASQQNRSTTLGTRTKYSSQKTDLVIATVTIRITTPQGAQPSDRTVNGAQAPSKHPGSSVCLHRFLNTTQTHPVVCTARIPRRQNGPVRQLRHARRVRRPVPP